MVGLFFLRVYRRVVVAGSVLGLAFWLIGAGPIWNAVSAPGLTDSAAQLIVNRLRKGDRLPVIKAGDGLSVPQSLHSEQKVPIGCDPAFSPVTTPAAKSIYGRCLV